MTGPAVEEERQLRPHRGRDGLAVLLWVLPLLLGLAACSRPPLPAKDVVDRIEAKLSADACIRPLSGWNRQYGFWKELDKDSPRRGQVDANRVKFDLRKAGRFGIRAGRAVTPPDEGTWIDDTPIGMAWGVYDIKADRLTIEFCGPNFTPDAR